MFTTLLTIFYDHFNNYGKVLLGYGNKDEEAKK